MQKIIVMGMMVLMSLVGCAKQESITFEGEIVSISEQSMVVTTKDAVGFDQAQVAMDSAEVVGELAVGKSVKMTIEPEIRESYPVQVTARQVEVMGTGYQKITAEEAKAIMDKDGYGTILDVRTIEEYNEGHIEGATLLPSDQIKDQAETILVDKEAVVLVYCRSGRRSEAAAKELIDMGYSNVYDFGGIIDWPYEVMKE